MTTELCYHGTNHIYQIKDMRLPAYFSSSEDVARQVGGEHIYRCRITAENAVTVDWEYCSWGGGYYPPDDQEFEKVIDWVVQGDPDEEDEREYWKDNGLTTDMYADYLNATYGYNLVIFENVLEESGGYASTLVAFPGATITEEQEERR